MQCRKDLKEFLESIPKEITVIHASKYINSSEIRKMYSFGINNFGENRTDSFLTKYDDLKDLNIKWHFIGHLQRNKAKEVINKIDFLHSLDSIDLAKIIEKEREEILPTFIEVSMNLEENKNGVPFYEVKEFLSKLLAYKKIKVVGLMMMAIKNDDENHLEKQFLAIKELRDNLEKEFNIKLPYLSMGMSEDYKTAIECGSTHIRLGRILLEEKV